MAPNSIVPKTVLQPCNSCPIVIRRPGDVRFAPLNRTWPKASRFRQGPRLDTCCYRNNRFTRPPRRLKILAAQDPWGLVS